MCRKGEITVFLAMILFSVRALLCVIVESAAQQAPDAICGWLWIHPQTPPWPSITGNCGISTGHWGLSMTRQRHWRRSSGNL